MILSEGITSVKAFALSEQNGAALVEWHSIYEDKLHQVYVNGKFAGVTVEPGQKQLIVPIPLSSQTAARVEVFAVEPADADVDFSDELNSVQAQSGRIMIGLARTDNLPLDGIADFYFEGNKLNERGIRILPEFADKGGFGLSCFAVSDFGYGGRAAIGFGKGNFGFGWFGFDADVLVWQSEELKTGNYNVDIKVTDSRGNESQMTQTGEITVIAPARPAEGIEIDSFDKQTGKLILKIK